MQNMFILNPKFQASSISMTMNLMCPSHVSLTCILGSYPEILQNTSSYPMNVLSITDTDPVPKTKPGDGSGGNPGMSKSKHSFPFHKTISEVVLDSKQ